jgi:hypothetical protein
MKTKNLVLLKTYVKRGGEGKQKKPTKTREKTKLLENHSYLG